MRNSFDFIASFYDGLASIIFGSEWEKIQLAPVEKLQRKQRVLIVGGGSGKLLEYFSKETKVTYVELSKSMMLKAQARESQAEVIFVHANYLTWKADVKFDAILLPFFLDNFDLFSLRGILLKTRDELEPKGELHVIDFQKAGMLKNLLIRLMYLFFKITADLEGKRLWRFDDAILRSGYIPLQSQFFFKSWIFYRIYRLN